MSMNLVTGGAGFIGSHVAESLVTSGHKVVILDDLSGGFIDNVPDGATFVQASILDNSRIKALFEEYRFDYVYHLAAYAAEGLSHFIKRFNYLNNLMGSINLINASINYGVKCFIFTSSIAVYGSATPPMVETMIPHPEDSYGIAKYAVEMELRACREMFGLDYIIFRPHNVYGPRQNIGDMYRNVIGIFMNQAMQGVPMTVFGDGTQTRAFSYIKDVAPIIAGAVDIPGATNEVFNIGADQPYAINTLTEMISEIMGINHQVVYKEARNEVVHAYSSHQKLRKTFSPPKPIALIDGLREMADWVKSTGPHKSQIFSEIEIRKGLPASWRIEKK
ncbi:MAG: NAD-dependent epimerase/dehydratase family protein [Anaerolineae bacterium]|nr:NAD-dependent epimerase/dehydratase family protein [Anaerolineae bacterium]